eukprot:364115-Chlamydomonas_euryale.AAC.5
MRPPQSHTSCPHYKSLSTHCFPDKSATLRAHSPQRLPTHCCPDETPSKPHLLLTPQVACPQIARLARPLIATLPVHTIRRLCATIAQAWARCTDHPTHPAQITVRGCY